MQHDCNRRTVITREGVKLAANSDHCARALSPSNANKCSAAQMCILLCLSSQRLLMLYRPTDQDEPRGCGAGLGVDAQLELPPQQAPEVEGEASGDGDAAGVQLFVLVAPPLLAAPLLGEAMVPWASASCPVEYCISGVSAGELSRAAEQLGFSLRHQLVQSGSKCSLTPGRG